MASLFACVQGLEGKSWNAALADHEQHCAEHGSPKYICSINHSVCEKAPLADSFHQAKQLPRAFVQWTNLNTNHVINNLPF